ncbi:MAG: hypothetical protein QOD40_1777 [Alphaproteobacteria bacterium]|nr:hypothetical protein [Alphaproteobacteria bacterium]
MIPSFKVVCFYTEDNEYKDHVERLRASLLKFNVPHEIHGIASQGIWELNCAYKAQYIREQWNRAETPVVWLDADATVEQEPVLFQSIDADFAAHKSHGHQLGSGTLYFGKTPAAKALLDQWVLRCEADPFTYDQTHLHSAWCDVSATQPLRTFWLPRSYLQIFDLPQEEPPVIMHWQASRKPKREGRSSGKLPFPWTKQGVESRTLDTPWRTKEETFWINEGINHIKPEIGQEFPEGFDVGAALRTAIAADFPVLEIGCGVGRIASLFRPDEYLGVDINPRALIQARASFPSHYFRIIDHGQEYPAAPTALLYTVMLHVSDAALPDTLLEAAKSRKRLIIAEIMDRRWRHSGKVPVFNRDPEEYILAMNAIGYRLGSAQKHPYKRYDQEPWNVGRDSRLTILTFQPEDSPDA